MKYDVCVVVRSVGERTANLCQKRLERQFGVENVFLVEGVSPFSETVKKAYTIGRNSEKKWTLLVDADVFFWPSRLEQFLNDAEKILMDEMMLGHELFVINTCFMDNFMGKVRDVGAHLYLSSRLAEAYECVDNSTLRPETNTMRKMALKGYYSYLYHVPIGVHDFFQSYEDIIRKGIQHSKKHSNIDEIITVCENGLTQNEDYKWFLKGIEIGEKYLQEEIRIDAELLRSIIVKEKIIIPKQETLMEEKVENTLVLYENSFCYDAIITPESTTSRKKALKDALLQYGFFKRIKKVKDMIDGKEFKR